MHPPQLTTDSVVRAVSVKIFVSSLAKDYTMLVGIST